MFSCITATRASFSPIPLRVFPFSVNTSPFLTNVVLFLLHILTIPQFPGPKSKGTTKLDRVSFTSNITFLGKFCPTRHAKHLFSHFYPMISLKPSSLCIHLLNYQLNVAYVPSFLLAHKIPETKNINYDYQLSWLLIKIKQKTNKNTSLTDESTSTRREKPEDFAVQISKREGIEDIHAVYF